MIPPMKVANRRNKVWNKHLHFWTGTSVLKTPADGFAEYEAHWSWKIITSCRFWCFQTNKYPMSVLYLSAKVLVVNFGSIRKLLSGTLIEKNLADSFPAKLFWILLKIKICFKIFWKNGALRMMQIVTGTIMLCANLSLKNLTIHFQRRNSAGCHSIFGLSGFHSKQMQQHFCHLITCYKEENGDKDLGKASQAGGFCIKQVLKIKIYRPNWHILEFTDFGTFAKGIAMKTFQNCLPCFATPGKAEHRCWKV